MPSLIRDIESIAIEAGRLILDMRTHGTAWSIKPDGSPVTAADRAAEAAVLARLEPLAAGVPIVAEERLAETGRAAVATDRYFLVDALDGTKEFIRGSAEFTVNIALVEAGVPVLGVVFAPELGELYVGHDGRSECAQVAADGAVVARTILHARAPGERFDALLSVSHMTTATEALLQRMPLGRRACVGSSLKFCLIAAGRADLYPRLSQTMQWDTAAGDAVLRHAGGCTLCMDGSSLSYQPSAEGLAGHYANCGFVAFGGSASELRELLAV